MYVFYIFVNILGDYKLHILMFRFSVLFNMIYVSALYQSHALFIIITVIYLEIWNGSLSNHLAQYCFGYMGSLYINFPYKF